MARSVDDQLRQAIRQSRKSQYRLSIESDVSQGIISRLMSKERSLTTETASRLAHALGLEIVLKPKRKARKRS